MAYWVASTYALLGETDLAFKWPGKAIASAIKTSPTSKPTPTSTPYDPTPAGRSLSLRWIMVSNPTSRQTTLYIARV
ncbi:MAG: hypothetical protein WKF34_08075 [Pyrinomonadaceae bacterium]